MPQLINNNNGDLVFANSPRQYTNQKNSITLSTKNTFVDSDIILNTLVTKAVLNTTVSDTEHKSFQIQIPNGNSTDITLTFAVDSSGNVLVT